jgi:hypothetical protein
MDAWGMLLLLLLLLHLHDTSVAGQHPRMHPSFASHSSNSAADEHMSSISVCASISESKAPYNSCWALHRCV